MTDSRAHIFANLPGLSDFIAVALQDLQYSEADEACEESRPERDTGTIWDVPDETFGAMARAYARFVWHARLTLAAATSDPWEYDWDNIGSDAYLTARGHGAGFFDGRAGKYSDRLQRLARQSFGYCEGLYFGDDGRVYWY